MGIEFVVKLYTEDVEAPMRSTEWDCTVIYKGPDLNEAIRVAETTPLSISELGQVDFVTIEVKGWRPKKIRKT